MLKRQLLITTVKTPNNRHRILLVLQVNQLQYHPNRLWLKRATWMMLGMEQRQALQAKPSKDILEKWTIFLFMPLLPATSQMAA